MAQDGSEGSVTRPVDDDDRIKAARAIVYDDNGDMIDPDDLEEALRAAGVTVTETDDGTTEYDNVPSDLSLSACHLAVDLREDPETFLSYD